MIRWVQLSRESKFESILFEQRNWLQIFWFGEIIVCLWIWRRAKLLRQSLWYFSQPILNLERLQVELDHWWVSIAFKNMYDHRLFMNSIAQFFASRNICWEIRINFKFMSFLSAQLLTFFFPFCFFSFNCLRYRTSNPNVNTKELSRKYLSTFDSFLFCSFLLIRIFAIEVEWTTATTTATKTVFPVALFDFHFFRFSSSCVHRVSLI